MVTKRVASVLFAAVLACAATSQAAPTFSVVVTPLATVAPIPTVNLTTEGDLGWFRMHEWGNDQMKGGVPITFTKSPFANSSDAALYPYTRAFAFSNGIPDADKDPSGYKIEAGWAAKYESNAGTAQFTLEAPLGGDSERILTTYIGLWAAQSTLAITTYDSTDGVLDTQTVNFTSTDESSRVAMTFGGSNVAKIRAVYSRVAVEGDDQWANITMQAATLSSVPEPTSLALLGLATMALTSRRRRVA